MFAQQKKCRPAPGPALAGRVLPHLRGRRARRLVVPEAILMTSKTLNENPWKERRYEGLLLCAVCFNAFAHIRPTRWIGKTLAKAPLRPPRGMRRAAQPRCIHDFRNSQKNPELVDASSLDSPKRMRRTVRVQAPAVCVE